MVSHVVGDYDNLSLHFFDDEFNEVSEHPLGYLPTGMSVDNDQLVVADRTNGLLHWYDREMREVKTFTCGYNVRGVAIHNDNIIVVDITNGWLRWYDRDMVLIKSLVLGYLSLGAAIHNQNILNMNHDTYSLYIYNTEGDVIYTYNLPFDTIAVSAIDHNMCMCGSVIPATHWFDNEMQEIKTFAPGYRVRTIIRW